MTKNKFVQRRKLRQKVRKLASYCPYKALSDALKRVGATGFRFTPDYDKHLNPKLVAMELILGVKALERGDYKPLTFDNEIDTPE